jgi:uncharacterized Zn finger protein
MTPNYQNLLLQSTPVPCRNCRTMASVREQVVVKENGDRHVEGEWRCNQCGSFIKRGTLRVIPAPAK